MNEAVDAFVDKTYSEKIGDHIPVVFAEFHMWALYSVSRFRYGIPFKQNAWPQNTWRLIRSFRRLSG